MYSNDPGSNPNTRGKEIMAYNPILIFMIRSQDYIHRQLITEPQYPVA